MLPAVIALAVCYLAGSALLVHFAANYTTAKYLRKQRKAAATGSSLLLTQPPGGSSSGPNGEYPVSNENAYREPADAAVDIHGINGSVRSTPPKRDVLAFSNDRSSPVTNGYNGYNTLASPSEQHVLRAGGAGGGGYPPMSHLFGPARPVTPGSSGFGPVGSADVQTGVLNQPRYSSSIQLPEQQRFGRV